MAAQVQSFHGSQDILFPEDAPPHYDAANDSLYSPPSSSSYSSYSQEVKYIFNPQFSTPNSGLTASPSEYSEINAFNPSPRSSVGTEKSRRRSYESSPRVDGHLSMVVPKSSSRGDLPPIPRGDMSSASRHSAGSYTHSPRPDPGRQPLSYMKGSPRLESQGSIGSIGSTGSAGSARSSAGSVRSSAGSVRSNASDRYQPPRKDQEKPRDRSNSDRSECGVIPEQEIYSAPHTTSSTMTTQAPTKAGPSVRPPPYWSRAYMNGQSAQGGAGNASPGKNLSVWASRRKTWSPPTCSRVLSCANSFSTMRSYRSNDQLDVEDEPVYEDLDAVAPPKIAPVSGILNKVSSLPSITDQVLPERDQGRSHGDLLQGPTATSTTVRNAQKSLIKPIAFKPIAAPHPGRYVNSPQHSVLPNRLTPPTRSHDLKLANHSAGGNHDDGYASQEYTSGSHSHSTSNTSSNSSTYQVSDSSMSGSGGELLSHTKVLLDRSGSYGSSASTPRGRTEGCFQTPSPSDSGVGEVETMLRDKDAEITHLRETMEHNETVIFQVYEEKRQTWAMQLKEVVAEWERRLQHHQQKSFKMEQALLLQLFKLQQERKNLRLDLEQVRADKERSAQRLVTLETENQALQQKLEEQQWETVQKSGEISLLKAQLKEAKEEAANKTNDLIGVKSQLKDISGSRSEQEQQSHRLQAEVGRVTQEMGALQAELEKLRRQVSRPKSDRYIQTEESRLNKPSPVSTAAPTAASSTPTSTATPTTSSTSTSFSSDSTSSDSASKPELLQCREKLATLQALYDREKEQWLVEKDKVINYQKHLQLNYVQMYRKNKMLELEMEQLMVEIENKDLTLSEKGAAGAKGAESTC